MCGYIFLCWTRNVRLPGSDLHRIIVITDIFVWTMESNDEIIPLASNSNLILSQSFFKCFVLISFEYSMYPLNYGSTYPDRCCLILELVLVSSNGLIIFSTELPSESFFIKSAHCKFLETNNSSVLSSSAPVVFFIMLYCSSRWSRWCWLLPDFSIPFVPPLDFVIDVSVLSISSLTCSSVLCSLLQSGSI